MNKKTWYNITPATEGTSEAEVSIYDAIGSFEINAKQFINELNDISADVINLRINSPGGCVIDGNAICNALQRHSAKVITHIDGLAASMASVVAMAGDEVHMADNALLMIHNPWTISMGDADELRADADLLDKMSNNILNAYGRSQYEADELKELMDAETWFTAQEAFDAGFVDHIENGLRAAASDITALAEAGELSVPVEKQLASVSKQLEAVIKTNAEICQDLCEQVAANMTLEGEISEAKEQLEQATKAQDELQAANDELTAEVEVKNAELEAKAEEIEAKDAEIEEAREITEESVAAKAAEIMQASTVQAVADTGDDDIKTEVTREEFNTMTPRQKSEFSVSGGKIIND